MILVQFYCSEVGNEPVREWLKKLNRIDRKAIGNDLQTIQLGWQLGLIGEPLVKSLGSGLFEIRTILPSNRISRVFFCIYDKKIVLLHAFIKKTQQTPPKELELARKRQKSLKN
jgi:phage-related protein